MDKLPSNPKSKRPTRLTPLSIYRSWKERSFAIKKRESRTIHRTENGFAVTVLNEPNWSLCWDEVTAVVAYKRDLYTVDQICFGFRILDDQLNFRCIDKDTPGFKTIIDDISSRTENAWPDKFSEVALPAFEFCWTLLWRAKGTPPIDENPYLHFIDPPIVSND